MKEFWNERFDTNELIYGEEPNQFVKQCIDERTPGNILFVGEGEGRNAIYAAKKGWSVFAVDQSEVAQQKALAWANKQQLSINYQVSDVLQYQPPSLAYFDVIVVCFLHLPGGSRKELHQLLLQWLKPEGEIVIQCYEKQQIEKQTGGPKNVDMLYCVTELREDFAGASLIDLEINQKYLEEGRYHVGESILIEGIIKK